MPIEDTMGAHRFKVAELEVAVVVSTGPGRLVEDFVVEAPHIDGLEAIVAAREGTAAKASHKAVIREKRAAFGGGDALI